MNNPSIKNPAYQSLSDQQLSEIDELCDRFEQELVEGLHPRIEAFLAEAPGAARDGLLSELLATEIELRFSRGEQVSVGDYRSRFPDNAELVKKAFDFACDSDVPTRPISQLDETTVTVDSAVRSVGTTSENCELDGEASLALQPFGRYTLQRLLGKGGMGSVYLAHDRELDRNVAIKFPEFDNRPDVATAAIERFRREARAMATVHHPNICPIFDVGQNDGRHFLTMAYIDGRSLSEVIGSLSQAKIVRLVSTIARALHAAHQAGVVHRDLKPSNVMIDQRGEPIVTDFGLASRDAVTESGLTHSGLIIGSPAYMAPEQVAAAHDRVGPRTDVYSLGVILYQLLTGCRPFEGAGLAVLGQISSGNPPTPPSQICKVDCDLEAICLKSMAHRMEDRLRSAEALADSLDDWLKTRDAAPVAARHSRRTTALIAGGILVLVLSSLLMAINNRPDAVEQTGSDPLAVARIESREPIPASEFVPDNAAPALLKAPFDEQQARDRQQEWADHLGLPVEHTNSIGMTFRLIPPGEFLMGSTPEEIEAAVKVAPYPDWPEKIRSEGPQHRVVLTKPIYVGFTEVTQSQYEKVMEANPSLFSSTGRAKEAVTNLETGNHPVETVSWYDAADFCAKLSLSEELKPFDFHSGEPVTSQAGTGYRLPTEAEWEYACRAGTSTLYESGAEDQNLRLAGWMKQNSGNRTHAVGELAANHFGLSDMHGNVWEWVLDGWDTTFYSRLPENATVDPFHVGVDSRVIRGGNWNSSPSECRSAFRLSLSASSRPNYVGLRVVLTAEAVKELLNKTSENPPPAAVAPFDEEQAQAHQQAWADHLGVPVEHTNSIGMKLRLIPPGEFLMGSTPEEIEAALQVADSRWREHVLSEGPQHKVVLTKPIYFGVSEVTQSQYEQVMGANPSHFSTTGKGKILVTNLETGNHPVEMVSWYDAAGFCAKLSQQEKLKPFYSRSGETVELLAGAGYRLATEAEWEYACRAGTTTRFWSGDQDEDLIKAGRFVSSSGGRTHAVGQSKSNPFGLSDMHGNVWEWVQDGWDSAFNSQFQKNAALQSREVARWFRSGLSVAGSFVCRCLTSLTVLRFHFPLIEPDGRISRIRLSDQDSRFRTREAATFRREVEQAQRFHQMFVGEAAAAPTSHVKLVLQPGADPTNRVAVHRAIGWAGGAVREVVRPAAEKTIHPLDYFCRFHERRQPADEITDLAADALHSTFRRAGIPIGAARSPRVSPAERVSQEVERTGADFADPRFRFVHREFEPLHHVLHGNQCTIGTAATQDHEVIGVVHDSSLKPLFVSEFLPPEHEPPHVEIRQQG